MKFNKWTLGLAAIGVVSLASAAQAEEKLSAVQSALSSTTISGYVDTSMQWNLGNGNAYAPPYKFGGSDKADGFNLNVVQITIAKPLDEGEWASGYRADLWFGPDANALGTGSPSSGDVGNENNDFAVRQAYVALRMPIGNGLDWKVGVFDSIIGYETVEDGNNPNHTRSYGHSIEPQTHTGVLATYRFNDIVSVAGGVANTVYASINSRGQSGASGVASGVFGQLVSQTIGSSEYQDEVAGSNSSSEASKTYMGSIALTAPDDWGWATGSTLYGGVVYGYNNSVGGSGLGADQSSWYAGATLATPVTGLKLGIAFDYLNVGSANSDDDDYRVDPIAWALGGYASYQVTEKLSLHGRVEYYEQQLVDDDDVDFDTDDVKPEVIAVTGTVQYDLWKNVISRLEVRWDHSYNGDLFGEKKDGFDGETFTVPSEEDAYMIALNIIYKF